MAGLKKLDEFVKTAEGGRPQALRSPRIKVVDGDATENLCVKLMTYGDTGMGKTYIIVALLLLGYKVMVITTDVGTDGLNTVRLKLRALGKPELLKNMKVVPIETFPDAEAFLKNPKKFWPEIYEWNPDILTWDGFSGFQQLEIQRYVGEELAPDPDSRKGDVSEARLAGLQFEQQDWGMIRNATAKIVDLFLSLKNVETGQVWHKYLNCLENIKNKVDKKNPDIVVEEAAPLLQGAGAVLASAGFDLIWRTVKRGDTFQYETKPRTGVRKGKDRGFEFPDPLEADMIKIWPEICEKLGCEPPPNLEVK